ncbi:hypothetical protein ACVCNR_21460 (plasmid) [Aquamicrobium terrae]
MAMNSSSPLINKVIAIVLVVIGFLILASGYRYGSPSSLVGGCIVLVIGVVLLIATVIRRNRQDHTS